MAVVQPLRPIRFETRPEPDRVNVVRLVEYLGPVSPELVLIDPELADRARALLPDAPGIRIARRPEVVQPAPVPLVAPAPRGRTWSRVALGSATAAVLAAVASAGWWGVPALRDDRPAVFSRPPVASSPDVPPPPATGAGPATETEPSSGPSTVVAPRFVWPAHAGAVSYRVALYSDGKQIFGREVRKPALQLPLSWTYDGRFHSLASGTYRWVVWPLLRNGVRLRQGPAIVSAIYTV